MTQFVFSNCIERSRIAWLRQLLAAAVLALLTLEAAAEDESKWPDFSLPENFQIHGFGSQAFIKTSDNKWFGSSDDANGSWNYYELGVNASWRPIPQLMFAAQLMMRDAGKTDDGSPRWDYALADLTMLSEATKTLGIRGGRIVNPLGLYNETRDQPFTRPSIFLPQSIYFDVNRNLTLSGDGGQLYGEYRTEHSDWYMQLGVIRPRDRDPDIQELFTLGRFPGHMEGRASVVGRLMYERNGGQWRGAVSGGWFNGDYKPQADFPNDLRAGSFDFNPLIFSLQYNAEKWSLTGEYALRYVRSKGFGPPPLDDSSTGESYYVQGIYRFSPKWQVVARYDVLYWDKDDKKGHKYEETFNAPSHSRFAKDFMVGLRWDINKHFMLRTEFHRVDGTGWLSRPDNPGLLQFSSSADQDDVERHWNLFAIQGSFRF